MLDALHNLGWTVTDWGDPLSPSEQSHHDLDPIYRLDTDVDGDGAKEIVLYGGGTASSLFAGVLDWDGEQWQVAWFDRFHTRYSGNIRLRVDDFDADGQPELLVETLYHPGSGTGYLAQAWDMEVIRCVHLHCHQIWETNLGRLESFGGGGQLWHKGIGSYYRLLNLDNEAKPVIESQTYGMAFEQLWSAEAPSGTLTARVLTATENLYYWDGAQYTPTITTALKPGYVLDIRPITETVDLNRDGKIERTILQWEPGWGGLWQTLSIYARNAQGQWQPTQVITAAFTGMSSAGVFLRDADDDGHLEVVQCTTAFNLQVDLQGSEWPSMQPHCIVYQWDSATRTFKPQP
jgi:hypothetical protein